MHKYFKNIYFHITLVLICLMLINIPGYAQSKKEPVVGCLLAWLLPGAGMVYAEQYPWAAAYFVVNGSLMTWWTIELFKSSRSLTYERINWTPFLILVPLRIIEYVHTWTACSDYNKKHGLSFNFVTNNGFSQIEYDLIPNLQNRPKIILGASNDCKILKTGVSINY